MTPVGITLSHTHLPLKSIPCCRSSRTIQGHAAGSGVRAASSEKHGDTTFGVTCLRGDHSWWKHFSKAQHSRQRALVGSICSATRFRSQTPACQMLWRYDAARADAVVHGAPCLAQPGPLSVLPRVESDMPFHLPTRLACKQRSHSDEITVCTSPTFVHDVRTLCRLPSGHS